MTSYYFNYPRGRAKMHPGQTVAECVVHASAEHRVVYVPGQYADLEAAIRACLNIELRSKAGLNGFWVEADLGDFVAEQRFGERLLHNLALKSDRFRNTRFD